MKILDSNVLFGFWPKRKIFSDLNFVKELANKHGISKMMITSMRGIFYDYELGNNETYEVCNIDKEMIPVMTINPCRFLGIVNEITKWQKLGINIFRFFPEYQNWPYSFAPFHKILKLLEPSHPVIILPARVGGHGKNGVISEIGTLAERYSSTVFLITGTYYGNLAEAITVTQENSNVMLETHLVNSPDGIRILAENVGEDRLVFGLEMPINYASSALLPIIKMDLPDEK